MESGDVITRCVVGDGVARVVVVIATAFAQEAARRHAARGAAAVAMARAGSAGLLLATLTKGEERVTMQLLGKGALGGLTVDARSDGRARVFVGNPRLSYLISDGARPRLGGALGVAGTVSVVRDLGLRDTFRGETALVDGEVDTDVEGYLMESEQIDSAMGCEVFLDGAAGGIRFAAGILVQALPGGRGGEVVAAARRRLRAGEVAATLAARLDQPSPRGGVATLTPTFVAGAALGPDVASLVQLDARPVLFHCPCSRERAATTLAMLGARDLAKMIEDDGKGQVTCEFCRAQYEFSDGDLETIRRELAPFTSQAS